MNEQRVAVSGAVLAAIAASLCCIVPILFAALGLGVFGAATVFESARPYLLTGAVLLLAFGFYWTYFRREPACAPREECATKPARRMGRTGLWIALFAVLAFASAPYYVGHVTSVLAGHPPSATSAQAVTSDAKLENVTIKIEGMSCTACEIPIRKALGDTAGVRSADVSYLRGDARIEYDPRQTNVHQLKQVVASTGYKAKD